MGNYATLKAGITANIKQNDSQAITGNILQGQLLAMVNELGSGYQFMGIATPETNPGTPDEKVFYIAGPGTYTHFSNIIVGRGVTGILAWDTEWTLLTFTGGAIASNVGIGDETYLSEILGITDSQEYAEISVDPEGKVVESLTSSGKKTFHTPVIFKKGFLDEKMTPPFYGKAIAWFGTSIPAGSSIVIPFEAPNGVQAYITNYRIQPTPFAEGDNLPAEYPVIAASLLKAATIYNESQGSSRIVRNTSDSRLLIRCKALTNSVQEICSYVFGSYNIDIANRTFTENHENTIGITTFLTTAGTWSSFVNNVCICLRQSYEISLVLRHLLPYGTQRTNYIAEVFGNYLTDIQDMLTSVGYTMDDLCGYGEADLFVLEHSVNDGISLYSGDVESNDIGNVEGAYNRIIGTILQYKTSARIAIVSNYARTFNALTADKASYLKAIAEHWSIPFFDASLYSQVSWNYQLTQGYWDASQIWHDTGFTWNPDTEHDTYESNCNFPTAIASDSLAQMELNIEPRQINGVWYWKVQNGYTWMWDGIHPFSGHDGRLTILLARLLANWISRINKI